MRSLLRGVVRWSFEKRGWRFVGEKPSYTKWVMVAAPHTSYWDLFYMLAVAVVFDVRLRWMGKHTVFWFPLGTLFRALGGIPVDRRASGRMVQQMADLFAKSDELVLVIAPEGARGHKEYWRSGFYHIACAAKVPIVLSLLDFGGKQVGLGPALIPSNDVRADMAGIRAFYEGCTGIRPENVGPVRLREEDDA
jgi:1-acyl-sn-glycerol-3-phosphate acyltransferase